MSTPKRVVQRRWYARHREQVIAERSTVDAKAARAEYWQTYWQKNGERIRARRRAKAEARRAARA